MAMGHNGGSHRREDRKEGGCSISTYTRAEEVFGGSVRWSGTSSEAASAELEGERGREGAEGEGDGSEGEVLFPLK